VNGVETGAAVCGLYGDMAEVVAGYVAGLPPGVVLPGGKTGFSEHPDTITKAITRPVHRENTILLFNPASLPYYADEFYGPAGKYIFTVSPDVLVKTRRPPVATGRSSGLPVAGVRHSREQLRRVRTVRMEASPVPERGPGVCLHRIFFQT
jgi:hypothetical protein